MTWSLAFPTLPTHLCASTLSSAPIISFYFLETDCLKRGSPPPFTEPIEISLSWTTSMGVPLSLRLPLFLFERDVELHGSGLQFPSSGRWRPLTLSWAHLHTPSLVPSAESTSSLTTPRTWFCRFYGPLRFLFNFCGRIFEVFNLG